MSLSTLEDNLMVGFNDRVSGFGNVAGDYFFDVARFETISFLFALDSHLFFQNDLLSGYLFMVNLPEEVSLTTVRLDLGISKLGLTLHLDDPRLDKAHLMVVLLNSHSS